MKIRSLQFHGDVTIVVWVKPENVAGGRQNIVSSNDKLTTTWAVLKK